MSPLSGSCGGNLPARSLETKATRNYHETARAAWPVLLLRDGERDPEFG